MGGLQYADDDDDDDDANANAGFGIGPAIGIAIALVAFCFFLFCTCALLGNIITGFLTDDDLSDKFKTNVGNKHGNMKICKLDNYKTTYFNDFFLLLLILCFEKK